MVGQPNPQPLTHCPSSDGELQARLQRKVQEIILCQEKSTQSKEWNLEIKV